MQYLRSFDLLSWLARHSGNLSRLGRRFITIFQVRNILFNLLLATQLANFLSIWSLFSYLSLCNESASCKGPLDNLDWIHTENWPSRNERCAEHSRDIGEKTLIHYLVWLQETTACRRTDIHSLKGRCQFLRSLNIRAWTRDWFRRFPRPKSTFTTKVATGRAWFRI